LILLYPVNPVQNSFPQKNSKGKNIMKSISNKKIMPGVKERIILKATELFYARGIHNTGINQIIKESKVAKASFYQHFPSKDDLVHECIEIYGNRISDRIRSMSESSTDLKDFAITWISSIRKKIEANPLYNGCPVANAAFSLLNNYDKKYQEAFAGIIESWTAVLNNFLKDLQNNKKIPTDINTENLARRIIHLYEGSVTMWKLTGDDNYFNELILISQEVSHGDKI